MRKLAIAIDGPAGAGKSSVAKILAANMGYAYLDTGAMYRAVTYEVLRRELTEEKDIVALAAGMDMTVKPEADAMHVVVNGHDVTDYIRTPEVSARVSAVSALAGVRAAMVGIQRRQAAKGGIVLDGRDIGTTVLPHADVKIFLTASVHTRALRRFKEMTEIFPRKAQLSWRRIIKAILIRLSLAWRLKTASSIIWPKKSSLRIRFLGTFSASSAHFP